VILDSGARERPEIMAAMERDAVAAVRFAVTRSGGKGLIAFSGGKDALVAAHIAQRAGVNDAVCEVSFYFPKQLASIKQIASGMGLNVTYLDSLSADWLRRNRHVVFSTDGKVRGWSFAQRQQKTVKRHAKKVGATCCIFGRRTEENSVPAITYTTKDGWQCHPLRNWQTHHIWTYISAHGLSVPWIYRTKFGEYEGNAPFYTLNPRNVGGVQQAWSLVRELEPTFTPERFGL
jgi:3'-phosphoadenosine 5'-phosphosulfate sulfotransferase (PAPS reductase)/FAD synthetase